MAEGTIYISDGQGGLTRVDPQNPMNQTPWQALKVLHTKNLEIGANILNPMNVQSLTVEANNYSGGQLIPPIPSRYTGNHQQRNRLRHNTIN